MIKLLDNTKISWYNYFYMLCMMVYLGYATVFARSLGNISTWGNTFGIIITIIFIYNNKIKFNSKYFISIAIFLIYATITSINNGLVNPLWISQWIIWLSIAYCICYAFKNNLFIIYESVMFQLCIISMIFWTIHIISPETIIRIATTFEFSTPHGGDNSNVVKNIIFYTINRDGSNEFSLITRNAGFAWEPGAFSSYICLAIFCNCLRSNFRIKHNYVLVMFIITLFSTQSTTGIMIFLIMIIVWLIINGKFLISFLLLPTLIYIFQLPFVQDKLLDEWGNIAEFDLSKIDSTGTYAIGRMQSLIINWQEFLRHPIIGLGGWRGGTWLNQFGYDNISTISGIGEMLAMYGAIMTSIFLILLFKSARKIATTMSKNGYLLLVVIIGMMFSYSLWDHPIYICFWMYAIYNSSSINKNYKITK